MNNLMTVSRTSSLPHSEVVPVAALGAREREQMFLLLTDYFEGVTRERFESDLAEKDSAVLLRDEAGTIKGFTTIMRLRAVVDHEPVVAFFSGDTIVARDCWGESELPRLWSGCRPRTRSGCRPRTGSGCPRRTGSGCPRRTSSGCRPRPRSGCLQRTSSGCPRRTRSWRPWSPPGKRSPYPPAQAEGSSSAPSSWPWR